MSSLSSTLGCKLTTNKETFLLAPESSTKSICDLYVSCVTNTSVFSDIIPVWFTSGLGGCQSLEDQQVSRCSSFLQCLSRNQIFVSWCIKAAKSMKLGNLKDYKINPFLCSANTGNSSARECSLCPTYYNKQKNVASEEKTFNWFLVGSFISWLCITVRSLLIYSVTDVFLLASPWEQQSHGGKPARHPVWAGHPSPVRPGTRETWKVWFSGPDELTGRQAVLWKSLPLKEIGEN